MRLGLPQYDLSKRSDVRRAEEHMKEVLRRGKRLVLWVSLPCAPWSTWQRVNAAAGAEKSRQIQEARKHSEEMFGYVVGVIRRLRKSTPPPWPRIPR